MIHRRSTRKAVSPLIAAVLLIAFTMAIAAILTAWVTTFTKDKKEQSEIYEEKMKCSGANFKADPMFASFNSSGNEMFNVKLENIGFETVVVNKVFVTFENLVIPVFLNVTENMGDMDTRAIEKDELNNRLIHTVGLKDDLHDIRNAMKRTEIFKTSEGMPFVDKLAEIAEKANYRPKEESVNRLDFLFYSTQPGFFPGQPTSRHGVHDLL